MSDTSCENCNLCYGCEDCGGCEGCGGCYSLLGGKNCKAVSRSIFTLNVKGDKFLIFRTKVSEYRFEEINSKIYSLLNGWRPNQTNAFELYMKAGNEWNKINLFELTYKNWNDSWLDMPKVAIDYIKSLPEFIAEDFKEITGLDVSKEDGKKKELLKKPRN